VCVCVFVSVSVCVRVCVCVHAAACVALWCCLSSLSYTQMRTGMWMYAICILDAGSTTKH
jgi:hypothetical protein